MSTLNRFLLAFAVISSGTAFAQMDRGGFETNKSNSKVTNLLEEGESVMVLQEQSVQEKVFTSRRVYSLLGGQLQADQLTLTANDTKVIYDLKQPIPMASVEIGYYPFLWHGLWGMKGGIGYGYLGQNQKNTKTLLHIVTADLLFMYRAEGTRSTWIKPFAGLGGTLFNAIQRGIEDYNTSESHALGLGVVGLGFNMNRLFSSDSFLDWELTGQYKRVFGSTSESANLTGSSWNAGISIAL